MVTIGTTAVREIMITNIVTVKETDKMETVAKRLDEYDINAAPVVDGSGKCIGVITSHDLVEYEAVPSDFPKEMRKESRFCLGIFSSQQTYRMPGRYFDEVGFHMSTALHTAEIADPLSRVARNMCRHHLHHVIVLGNDERPIGMLSSLDLLGFVIGEPVCRSASCPTDTTAGAATKP